MSSRYELKVTPLHAFRFKHFFNIYIFYLKLSKNNILATFINMLNNRSDGLSFWKTIAGNELGGGETDKAAFSFFKQCLDEQTSAVF